MYLVAEEPEGSVPYPVGERHQRKTTRVLIRRGPSRLPGRQHGQSLPIRADDLSAMRGVQLDHPIMRAQND
jgi:hypothetical protein